MLINRKNYENYIMDYLDNTLSGELLQAMIVFLENNPDIAAEIKELNKFQLNSAEQPSSQIKSFLKAHSSNSCIISSENIDYYLIARLEGILSENELKQLDDFLKNNPQYIQDAYAYSLSKLPVQQVQYTEKESLKKKEIIPVGEINSFNYEEYYIAFHENILTESEKQLVVEFVKQNPDLQHEFDIFRKTFLKPDKSIVFTNKENLKKPEIKRLIPRVYWYRIAAAASILLMVGISLTFLFPTKGILNMGEMQGFANIHTVKTIQGTQTPTTQVAQHSVSISNTAVVNKQPQPIIITLPVVSVNHIAEKTIEKEISEPGRSFYTEIYSDYLIVQQRQNKENATLAGETPLTLNTLAQAGVNQVKKWIGLPTNKENNVKFSGWTLAQTGIAEAGRLLGTPVNLTRQTDESGEVEYFALGTDRFSFSRKKVKK